MIKADDINSVILQIENSLTENMNISSNLIRENSNVETYDTVTKGNVIKSYSKVLDDYNIVCSALSDLAIVSLNLRSLKKQVMKIEILPSLKQKYSAHLESLINNVVSVREAFSYLKDLYDAKLRFYNSCSIIQNSSRYRDLS